MKTKQQLTHTTATFVALSIAGISVAVSAHFVPDALDQTVMVAIGSAIFGAGLAFFLMRIFILAEK